MVGPADIAHPARYSPYDRFTSGGSIARLLFTFSRDASHERL
jgi:hypothetical protein